VTLLKKMQEATQRAAVLSLSEDDLTVSIEIRNYGFLVCGALEVGDRVKRHSIQLLWEQVDKAWGNPLLTRVEHIASVLRNEAA
jgi:hypothetical protein